MNRYKFDLATIPQNVKYLQITMILDLKLFYPFNPTSNIWDQNVPFTLKGMRWCKLIAISADFISFIYTF